MSDKDELQSKMQRLEDKVDRLNDSVRQLNCFLIERLGEIDRNSCRAANDAKYELNREIREINQKLYELDRQVCNQSHKLERQVDRLSNNVDSQSNQLSWDMLKVFGLSTFMVMMLMLAMPTPHRPAPPPAPTQIQSIEKTPLTIEERATEEKSTTEEKISEEKPIVEGRTRGEVLTGLFADLPSTVGHVVLIGVMAFIFKFVTKI